jgi:two-component system, chemotaxis family, response regulator Rcp1
MNDQQNKKFRILLVEDNPADISLTREALNRNEIVNEIHVVHNGVEALNFLEKKNRPDLIFLDLNLPKMTGLEVLKEIKEHGKYRRIPVIILTISNNEEDLIKAYDLHANCYINKPLEIKEFYAIMSSIVDFFFKTVKLSNV